MRIIIKVYRQNKYIRASLVEVGTHFSDILELQKAIFLATDGHG